MYLVSLMTLCQIWGTGVAACCMSQEHWCLTEPSCLSGVRIGVSSPLPILVLGFFRRVVPRGPRGSWTESFSSVCYMAFPFLILFTVAVDAQGSLF